MDAGTLRHRIELQTSEATLDTFGARTETWTTYASVSAEVRPLTGAERYGAQQVQASMTHSVRLRWRDGVTNKHRIRWTRHGSARILDINAVLNLGERDAELVLLCSEAAT